MSAKTPTIFQSLFPIIILMILIGINVFIMPDDTLGGANQLSLLIASAIACAIALKNGIKWKTIESRIVHTVSVATSSILILLIIGLLSGTWMLCGIVPTMIYYGLKIITPDYFLPATIIIAAIISVMVGSSWSTVATVGVALLGIGRALGFEDGLIAGAIISGAYFGDKISPLSDTTNLAAAIAKVPIFTHIKYMMQTTVPTFLISLAIFLLISIFKTEVDINLTNNEIEAIIASKYNISPFLLLVPLTVVVLIAKKVPTVIVLFLGGILGGLVTLVAQPQLISELSGEGTMTLKGSYEVISRAMFASTNISTGNSSVDSLLTTNGMYGMLNTVWLVLTAMIFGGVLEAGHFLTRLINAIESKVKSPGMAVTTTATTSILFNFASGDQYMAIVVPGKMSLPLFERLNLRPELLSRTLEDSGTVTSVLIPWNTCGAAQSATLGVATMTYAPFAVFCYLSPVVTLIYAWLKIKIKHNNTDSDDKENN